MSSEISDKEYAACLKLPAPKRYSHFIKRVADRSQIWSLRNSDGWVLASDDEGSQLIPIWPHARYAQSCAVGDWADCTPQAIEVHDFLDRWIPGSEKDGRCFSVFLVPDGAGVPVDAQQLSRDLKEELDKVE